MIQQRTSAGVRKPATSITGVYSFGSSSGLFTPSKRAPASVVRRVQWASDQCMPTWQPSESAGEGAACSRFAHLLRWRLIMRSRQLQCRAAGASFAC